MKYLFRTEEVAILTVSPHATGQFVFLGDIIDPVCVRYGQSTTANLCFKSGGTKPPACICWDHHHRIKCTEYFIVWGAKFDAGIVDLVFFCATKVASLQLTHM